MNADSDENEKTPIQNATKASSLRKHNALLGGAGKPKPKPRTLDGEESK